MKCIKLIISAVLLICTLLLLFACKGEAEVETETVSETASEDTTETEYITLAENGIAHFGIVYSEDSSELIKEGVSFLYDAVKKRSEGGAVEIEQIYGDREYITDKSVILIGNTGAPESTAVMKELGYGDFCIRFSGNKLVVAAYSDYALDRGISELIKQIKASTEDGKIAFPTDFNITKTFDEPANHLPVYESKSLAVSAPEGDDTSLAVIKSTSLEEYEAYLGKLSRLGYTLYTSNVIEKNYFATYFNEEYLIHAGFYAYEGTARITIEKKTALAGLKSDNVYTPKEGVTTTLAMMGIGTKENDYASGGMGFIIQLADGSFLVIDGAFAPEADRVYEYMRSLVPEGKITVAAWIITHNDGDHRDCMPVFLTKYGEEVFVERFISNFPHAYGYMDSGTNQNTGPIASAKDHGCEIIKAHTGQKFYIRDVEIEMLYTIDSLLPEPLTIFNNTSLVFTVERGDDRLLFMGDASDEVAAILNKMYSPKFLRCDFLQLAHHGIRNGHGTNMPETVKLYKSVQAEVVLWPSSWGEYLNVNGDAKNQTEATFAWNCAATDIAREVYIAGGNEFTVFNLPYEAFSATKRLDRKY